MSESWFNLAVVLLVAAVLWFMIYPPDDNQPTGYA